MAVSQVKYFLLVLIIPLISITNASEDFTQFSEDIPYDSFINIYCKYLIGVARGTDNDIVKDNLV